MKFPGNNKELFTKKWFISISIKLLLIIPFYFLAGYFVIGQLSKSIYATHAVSGPNVVINNNSISVMLADDFEEWGQGLSDRHSLGQHNGMLFLFPQKQARNFWMKNMHFPLDIIWIDGNRIIKIDKRLQPEGENPTKNYKSILPVDIVLEVNGGFTEAFNIRIGDRIKYNLEL